MDKVIRMIFNPDHIVMTPVIAICTAVFGLWQFPVFGLRWMYKNFAHMANSGITRTILTSAFSHVSLTHFLFNMVALWSFSDAAFPLLGPEYMAATVVSGAVVSGLSQHLYSVLARSPNPSLGASGFVFSIVTYVALTYPTNQALFFFVIPMSLMTLLKGLVVFDVIGLSGLISRFTPLRLAHANHLGGVALGATVWWLHQRNNRKFLADSLPSELVSLYSKSYDAIIKRQR